METDGPVQKEVVKTPLTAREEIRRTLLRPIEENASIKHYRTGVRAEDEETDKRKAEEIERLTAEVDAKLVTIPDHVVELIVARFDLRRDAYDDLGQIIDIGTDGGENRQRWIYTDLDRKHLMEVFNDFENFWTINEGGSIIPTKETYGRVPTFLAQAAQYRKDWVVERDDTPYMEVKIIRRVPEGSEEESDPWPMPFERTTNT